MCFLVEHGKMTSVVCTLFPLSTFLCHAQEKYIRIPRRKTHNKVSLPFENLSCDLCRVSIHGDVLVMFRGSFAVCIKDMAIVISGSIDNPDWLSGWIR
jgi:hypothetical protein